MSKSTAFNCRAIARQIPEVNARKLGYSEMLRIVGILKDQTEEDLTYDDDYDDDEDFDLSLVDDDDYDEGEALPTITYHNFLPKLESVSDTLEAIAQMDYSAESREEALERYLEAKRTVAAIKRHAAKVEKLLERRIGTNRKGRRAKNSA